MSERLYKGKRKDNGDWVAGYYVKSMYYEGSVIHFIIDRNSKYDDYDSFSDVYEVDPKTVRQSTGLTDRNGVEIFEGDIVEYEGKRYSIIYLAYYARFATKAPNTVFCVFDYKRGGVIGNIYDNPELLKE